MREAPAATAEAMGGGHDTQDYYQDLEDFKNTLKVDGYYDEDDYIAYTSEGQRFNELGFD